MTNETNAPTTVRTPKGCLQAVGLTCGRWLVHCLAAVIVFMSLMGGFGPVAKFFVENRVLLPALTARIFEAYYFLNDYWFIVLPLFFALDAAILAGLELCPSSMRWLARLWFTSVLFCALLAVGVISLATGLPFVSFDQGEAEKANSVESVSE